MKRKIKIGTAAILILVYFVTLFTISYESDQMTNKALSTDEYWMATHYFADGWPKNMWDSEFENVDSDFRKMKEDGFNSVVLLVPWREFQPEISEENEYHESAFKKLEMLMQKAEENDLGIILRLGYFWDYYDNRGMDELYSRYWDIIGVDTVNKAWMEYSSKIYNQASQYDNFLGGFICWEDFWGAVGQVKAAAGKNDMSYEYSDYLGYGEYLKENYTLEEINELFDEEFKESDRIYLPSADTAAFGTFYEFYDQYLNDLLAETQAVFPGLSMEVRVDDDLVINAEGENEYFSHKATYACESADYSTIVYGIPMGFENNGERVTWQAALEMTGNILNKVSQSTDHKKLFIDQFLFFDNTPKFSYNAQIINDQIDEYLLNCPDTLLDYSMGYGIWTYKDYYFDAIANGEFAKGLESWAVDDGVRIEKVNNSNKCYLSAGKGIEQVVEGKIETDSESIYCTFDVELLSNSAAITVTSNGIEQKVQIDKSGSYTVEFENNGWKTLRIESDTDVYIDNIAMYNFIQQGLLYDTDWNEEKYIPFIRKMNKMITKKVREREESSPFFSFVDNFWKAELDGLIETDDFPWGENISVINSSDNKREVFFVPDTGIQYHINLDENKRKLYLKYGLQEDASNWKISDGAEIIIRIADENGQVLEEIKGERVKSDGSNCDITVNLGKYAGMSIEISLECIENPNNSYDADWIVLKEAYID